MEEMEEVIYQQELKGKVIRNREQEKKRVSQ